MTIWWLNKWGSDELLPKRVAEVAPDLGDTCGTPIEKQWIAVVFFARMIPQTWVVTEISGPTCYGLLIEDKECSMVHTTIDPFLRAKNGQPILRDDTIYPMRMRVGEYLEMHKNQAALKWVRNMDATLKRKEERNGTT